MHSSPEKGLPIANTHDDAEQRTSARWHADERTSATLVASTRVDSPHPTVVIDELGRVVSLNAHACALLDRAEQDVRGWVVEDLLGFSIALPGRAQNTSRISGYDAKAAHGAFSEQALRSDGTTFPVDVTCAQIHAQGRHLTIVHFCDLSARRANDALLRKLSTGLEQLADHAVIIDDEATILYVNQAFERISGFSREAALGKTMSIVKSGKHDAAFYAEIWTTIRSGKVYRGEVVNRNARGDLYIDEQSISPYIDQGSGATYYISTGRDVTDRKFSDPLTGLPTRNALLARVELALARIKRHPNAAQFALIFIDLDRFKSVNDAHGILVGDRVLTEVGNRIRQTVRESDAVTQVSHLDRDEFAVLVEELQSIESVQSIAQRIIDAIRKPIVLPGVAPVLVTASMGIAAPTAGHGSPEAILQDAETAMRKAKAMPDEPCQVFDPAMHQRAQNRSRMESELRKALSRDEFILHYQPVVSLEHGRITSCEALVRWLHPTRGFLSPLEFIEVAEETGLIVPLGELVLEKACRQARAWQSKGYEGISVAVNVSPRQFFEERLVETIQRVLASTGLAPELLKIEITESAAVRDPDMAIAILESLKALGIRILIDDFGTGHSSLSRISRFPLHKLKIDRSFVMQVPHSTSDNAVASTIIAMAHGLGLEVIAEGVETLAQAEFLQKLGCEEMQGYYFSKPIIASEFEQLLRNDTRLSLQPK